MEPDMPTLHPQSLLMETAWVMSWFKRLMRHAKTAKPEDGIIIMDRSPFSAVFYGHSGHLLEPLIRQQLVELRTHVNIVVRTVHIDVEPESLWKRIQDRLVLCPERKLLNENDRGWMERTQQFYQNFAWDVTVDNSVESAAPHTAAVSRVLRRVCEICPEFQPMVYSCHAKALGDASQITTPAFFGTREI